MSRQRAFVAALILFSAITAFTQTALDSPKFTVAFQSGVPLEKVWVQYVLYGPFGAHGDFVRDPVPQVLQVPTVVEGKHARQIKMIVWAPGCRMSTFDFPLKQSSDDQESFSCSPVPTVTLVGRISPAIKLPKKEIAISVDYVAGWACNFFGLSDCMVPQIPLGMTPPDPDGAFQIEVPDFSVDPIASDLECGTHLQLTLHEAKSFNVIAFLEPESDPPRTNGNSLKISSFYPQNLVFIARKAN
jgi:hypothetical protein